MTDAIRVTEEFLGEGKGVLNIMADKLKQMHWKKILLMGGFCWWLWHYRPRIHLQTLKKFHMVFFWLDLRLTKQK